MLNVDFNSLSLKICLERITNDIKILRKLNFDSIGENRLARKITFSFIHKNKLPRNAKIFADRPKPRKFFHKSKVRQFQNYYFQYALRLKIYAINSFVVLTRNVSSLYIIITFQVIQESQIFLYFNQEEREHDVELIIVIIATFIIIIVIIIIIIIILLLLFVVTKTCCFPETIFFV